jgi:hypothetical protein
MLRIQVGTKTAQLLCECCVNVNPKTISLSTWYDAEVKPVQIENNLNLNGPAIEPSRPCSY